MKDYRVQDGCHNCQHVFVGREYESNDRFWCTLNAPPRPKCGSVFLGEAWTFAENRFEHQAYEWDQWAEGRRVESAGICSEWRKS